MTYYYRVILHLPDGSTHALCGGKSTWCLPPARSVQIALEEMRRGRALWGQAERVSIEAPGVSQ